MKRNIPEFSMGAKTHPPERNGSEAGGRRKARRPQFRGQDGGDFGGAEGAEWNGMNLIGIPFRIPLLETGLEKRHKELSSLDISTFPACLRSVAAEGGYRTTHFDVLDAMKLCALFREIGRSEAILANPREAEGALSSRPATLADLARDQTARYRVLRERVRRVGRRLSRRVGLSAMCFARLWIVREGGSELLLDHIWRGVGKWPA